MSIDCRLLWECIVSIINSIEKVFDVSEENISYYAIERGR